MAEEGFLDKLGSWVKNDVWGGGLTGADKIKNYVLDPYFRKSYSVIDQLSPFIKVGVKIPTPKKVINEQEQKFFDIPYNFIKSLKVENKYGESATDVLTLTLEDPQGTISAILFAHLHLLSSSRGLPAGGMATVAIQYGYADVNPFKIALKTITPRPYLQSDYKEYLILGADISYENMKQKLTITARSRYNSGINPEVALQSTPFAKIGVTPLVDLVRNRLMMIPALLFQKTYGKSRQVLGISDGYPGLKEEERKGMLKPTSFFTYAFEKEENKLFLSKTRLIKTKSTITNSDEIKKTKDAIEALDTQRTSTYSTISLHPYLCLIYLIYQYLEVLKESNKKLKIFFLTGYEEKKDNSGNGKTVGIDGWDANIGIAPEDFVEAKIKDWLEKLTQFGSTISSKAKINWIKPMEFKITEKDTWSTIINKVAEKVMVNYVAKEKDKNGKEIEVIKQHPLKFTTLFYPKIQGAHNNHNSKKANLKKVLEKRRNAANYKGIIDSLGNPNDETLIILIEPSGSVFKEASDSPLQKYTIFPKTKVTRKTTDVIFDSGSKNLIDENFPDVISFNPKIKFKELIDSLIGQQSNRHDFFTNEDQLNGENIRIKDITPTPPNATIIKDAKYYQTLNKAVKALIDELNKFADGTRPGDMELKINGGYIFFPPESNVGIRTTKMSEGDFKSLVKNGLIKLSQTTPIHKNFVEAILHDYKEFVRSQLGAPLSRSVAKAFNTSEAVFQGEPNSPIYNKMILEQEKFYKLLKNQNANFDAELKILGEPAFSYTWSGGPPTIFLEVNAPDGTPNFLCTGLYSITGITQDIEGGKFTTTLQLKWDHSKTINDYLEGN